jgi:hypothetical protein
MFYKRMKFILYLYIKFASLIIDNKDIMVRLGVISLVMLTLITGSLLTGISCSSESSDSSENNQISQDTTADNQNVGNKPQSGKCGDGICDRIERERGVCPKDCADVKPGTVYFGLMVHLEGWNNEMYDQPMFDRHADEARKLANIFEDYCAKVTFEASPEFVAGCKAWGDNVLQELHDRGHGVGVHADKGYYPPGSGYTLAQFTSEIKQMKDDLEDLVNFNIQHVSGICSDLDWAKAAIDAGYVFTTGGVGYCAMSMPVNMRPAEYRNCRNPSLCHGNMPLEMKDRIHPWRINTAKGDWTVDDPDGRLVNIASDGGIKSVYEDTLSPAATHGSNAYSDDDIPVLIDKVEEAISLSEAGKVNVLYFSLSIGAEDVDPVFYNKMFTAMQPYIDSGQLEYKTMNEMYEEYIMGT